MNKVKFLAVLLSIIFSVTSMAQGPGGHPGGGFPGGGHPGGFPGGGGRDGRPSQRDMQRMQQYDQRANTVKQKKRVTNGSTFKVVGTIKDSTNNQPLEYMNVALLDASDSSFVKGGTTNLEGYFEIAEVPSGDYLLRATYIGYQNRLVPVKVENNTAVGIIKLKPGAATMKEVTITAERPLYAMDGEKMIYNVSEDPSIQTGTTTDALQNAPGVEVDIEGNITLRGVSSVEIWVNDKPSKLTEENLKTYLETLPANALDRIETITNPSAKYATEAEAVINIITNAHVKSNHFISFGVNAASQPNVSPWLSYTWANERLSINSHISARYSNRLNNSDGWSVTRTGADTNNLDTVMFQQDSSSSESTNLGINFSINISYDIDSMSDFSIWTNGHFNFSNSYAEGWNLRDQSYAGGNTYEYSTINDASNQNLFGMFGGDYTKKFDLEGHNLRVNLFGNYSVTNGLTNYSRVFSQTDSDPRNQSFYKYYDNQWRGMNVDLSARYNRPYSRQGEMSYGLKYNYNHGNRDYLPYLLDTFYNSTITLDNTLLDALRRYTFLEHKNNIGADAEWTHRWGGFTMELGFGAELSNDHFIYNDTPTPDDTTYNFITYNPSVHLSYRTKDLHNFKLNYSLRMRNPDEANLALYKRYTEDSYSIGNRNLKQSYTHNAEMGWTKFFMKFGSVGLEGYGRLSTGEIDNLTDVTADVDPILGRIINYTTPYNMGSSWRYGMSANVAYRPSGFLNIRLYTNVYNYGYKMLYEKLADEISDSKWSYSIRLNMWTKVFDRYQIHASANYTSPTIGLMSQRSARYFVNCGVRADFFKRKLSAFVNVQDIFNWGYKIGNVSGNTNPYFLSSSKSRSLNSRYISAGITLRFGKMELERKSTSGSEENGVQE